MERLHCMCPAVSILYEYVLLVVLNMPKLFKRAWNILRYYYLLQRQNKLHPCWVDYSCCYSSLKREAL